MSFTTEAANNLLLLMLTNAAWANIGNAGGLQPSSAAGAFYLSAHTADPGAGGSQSTNEISYTGYSRQTLTRVVTTTFTVTTNTAALVNAQQWGAMSGGSGGTITHFGLGTDSSGTGHLILRGTVTPNITVTTPVNPGINAGTFWTETTT